MGVGTVVSFVAILVEVVLRELPKCRSFVCSASQQVVPFEENESVGLKVGSVAARDVGEVDVLVAGGVADGVFDGGGELVL